MVLFKTPVSVLQESVNKFPRRSVLKIPQQSSSGTTFKDITYPVFAKDVELSARYWKHQLSKLGVKDRAVVGVWLKGLAYLDVVNISGLQWAGYIPQLISLRMTNPSVVYELLEKSEAVALIHEPAFHSMLQNSPLPIFPAEDVLSIDNLRELPLPAVFEPSEAEDIMLIYHTSGSISGRPKLVPITAKWLDYIIGLSGTYEARNNLSGEYMTSVCIGSFCHMAASFLFWFSMREGSCVIIPSSLPYPILELRHMFEEHGLSTASIFPPFLSAILRQARNDPSLLASLQKADTFGSGGLALDPADEAWGRSQGLGMINVFASTELGLVMMSDLRKDTMYLEPMPGAKNEFVPLEDSPDSNEQLLELVILPDAPNCPVPSLRSEDGKFYSGDLFVEMAPGQYLSKGRNDNWIKMETALRCDTASLEANTMETCGDDLVSAVVVVGVGRPCPTIVIEPKDASVLGSGSKDTEESVQKLKDDIFQRITPFHQRRYMHERIDDARYILVVPQGTLPRTATKGNIRRQETEKVLKGKLDAIYAK
ncbi:hypothetical protein FSARC_5543 [Fusarium sarcochroum]|uniref:AMP-dependent synthetase/ligase domain-containing protein n=1 Tax=Fusarium sarcochroum TaxID=1208366 RepID=A0A8H4X9E3_9HYPO|nr:hypothetical protein FSARC_5543 [Fusarium sarcochroum]